MEGGLAMAHLCTYAADGKTIRNVTGHYDRWGGDLEKAAKREQIDPKLTNLNYNLAPDRGVPLDRYCERRIAYYRDLGAKLNDSSRPVCDIVHTLPKGLPAELAPLFFRASYGELLSAIGGNEDDVVCAYVHLDEPGAQPHMHFCFIQASSKPKMTNDKSRPLKWTKADEARNPEHKAGTVKKDGKGTVKYKRVPVLDDAGKPVMSWSLSPSALWTKAKLKTFHEGLDKAVGAALGMPDGCGIRLDADDGRKKLSKLDHDEFKAVTKAKADMEAEAAQARQAAAKAHQEKALAEARLEGVRQAEQAGPVELGRAARDGGAEGDERAEEAAGEALDREIEQLEQRVRDAEQRRAVLAGRCRTLRAGREAAWQRLARAAQQTIAELPHLGTLAQSTIAVVSRGAGSLAESARALIGRLTGIEPVRSVADARASVVIDDECKIWRPRAIGEQPSPTGVDARTGLTDEQAAQASAERVAARKARWEAGRTAENAAAAAVTEPARQAARLAGMVSHNVGQWRRTMAALGYKTYPATFGRFAAASDGAGAAVVEPQTVGKRGGVLRYAGKPFEQALADVTNALASRTKRGMTRAQAVSEVLALAEACRAGGNSPEAMYTALRRGWINQDAVDFAHEVRGWDYWATPEQRQENAAKRHAVNKAIHEAELCRKVNGGKPLTAAEKRGLTPEQRKQWEAAKAPNRAAHPGFHGSTGTPGASGDGASQGYRSRAR